MAKFPILFLDWKLAGLDYREERERRELVGVELEIHFVRLLRALCQCWRPQYISILLFVWVASNLLTILAGAQSGSNERRLLNDLLEYYNQLERPVFNDSDAINLTFGLTLQQIIDVVSELEENQIFRDFQHFRHCFECWIQRNHYKYITREGYKVSFSTF